jgi:ribosomal protein S12 methylthiotransferase
VDQYFGTTELPALLKALGADYKHELLRTVNHYQKNYLSKIAEGCDRPCSFVLPIMRGKHVSQTIEKLVKEAEGLARDGVKS